MSKRLSLSLSSNPSGINSSPKPSIFSSLLANKTNSNLKSTQNNNSASNSGSRHATTPKKIFNLDFENDEIDLVNHTANDYEFSFSSSKSAKPQLKKIVNENNSPASGSKSSTPSKTKQKIEKSNNITKEKPNEVSTQNSSWSSSPTKSQPSRPLLSTPPSSPIKMRKIESMSSDSFDEFDDTVKAKILESDSEDDFDTPTNTSRASNKAQDSVEKIDSSPLRSPKQKHSPIKSQVSFTSGSQQAAKPKQSSQPTSQAKQSTKPIDTVADEDVPWQSKPSKATDKAKTKQEAEPTERKEAQSKDSEATSKPSDDATKDNNKEQTIPSSAPRVVANRRLLQVAFDSPTKPTQEPPKPKATNEEKPRPLSLFGNKSNAITLNSDDDFMPTSQPVTKLSTKLSLMSTAKSADKSAKKDDVNKAEATKEVKRKLEAATETKKTPPNKDEAKQTQEAKAKSGPSKPTIHLGSKDVPLNIGSDSSFEVDSPVKKKEVKETKARPKEALKNTASQTPMLSIADLSRARSERIKQKETPSSGSLTEAKASSGAAVPTIRSKEREFPIATEEDREKFIQWSIEEYKSALAKGNKSSGEDNFTEEQVKDWSKAKITAWKLRHTNPNTYYYRFTDLGVLQHNGKFTVEEHTQWMKRYIEFKINDWPIGNYWGVFSKAIPHRVGYQCASYFRSLLKQGVIVDNSVKVPKSDKDQDEEVQVEEPTKSYNVLLPENELSLMSSWKTKETKEEENKINQWICEYHNLDLSSHNEKSESEVSPSSGGSKKRKAEDELTPDNNMNRSPVEQGNKKRKIVSPVGNTPTLDRFFALSKKTTPTQPSKAKKPIHADRAIVRAAVASTKTRSPVVSPSSLKQQDLSRFFSGVSSVSTNTLQHLMESGKIPPPDMVRLAKPPMGLEWPRMITPYLGEGDMSGVKVTGYNYASSKLPKIAWDEVESAGPFFALLLDPPLRPKENDGKTYGKGYVTIDDVQTWIKVSNALIPKGFLFVWIEKEFISDIIRLAKKWKFLYVENLMWMKKHVNNKMMEEESEYFNKSKLSLLLFRKGHGDMELRHQRNPDVVEYPSLETKDDVEGMRCEKPMEYVYNMIETLLPEANFNSTTGKGRMLEVWASKNAKRKGWTHIYIEPSSAADLRESMDSLNNSMQVVEDSDSDDDILMQSALNESELFGEEKSSDSDVEAVLDEPSSNERSSNNNIIDDDDDVVMVSHVNRPEIIIEDASNDNDVKMHEQKQTVVIEDEEDRSDREPLENEENKPNDNNNNEGDDEDQLESGSINGDDLEDFWNALTND